MKYISDTFRLDVSIKRGILFGELLPCTTFHNFLFSIHVDPSTSPSQSLNLISQLSLCYSAHVALMMFGSLLDFLYFLPNML